MILVTGGTGLVGAHLLLQLVKTERKVRAIHRKTSNLNQVEKVFNYYEDEGSVLFQNIEWVIADLNDLPALESAFMGVQYVYHAAAYISFDPRELQTLLKINTEGTANIVNLCISKNVKKLCYVSTIGAIGKSTNNTDATENNEWNDQHVNVYALAKYAAEMEVWRGTQEGLDAVIVNPGVIIGPGFWHTGSGALFVTANKGYRYYPPGGSGFVTVHDVIRMMTTLMNSEIKNERFIAVAENVTFHEILKRLTHALGKPKPTKQLKYWQLTLGCFADFIWSTITGSSRKITKSTIYSMKHRDAYANKKAKEMLNFEFENLDPTIRFSCERFLEENR